MLAMASWPVLPLLIPRQVVVMKLNLNTITNDRLTCGNPAALYAGHFLSEHRAVVRDPEPPPPFLQSRLLHDLGRGGELGRSRDKGDLDACPSGTL